MSIEMVKDKWPGSVREISLGATPAEGGSRTKKVVVGGHKTLPFMHLEGEITHRPVVAVEIKDRRPDDWSPLLMDAWEKVMDDPARWAQAAEAAGADLIQLSLSLTDQDESRLPRPGRLKLFGQSWKPVGCR